MKISKMEIRIIKKLADRNIPREKIREITGQDENTINAILDRLEKNEHTKL